MLIIGSVALQNANLLQKDRNCRDLDIIGTYSEMRSFIKTFEATAAYPLSSSSYYIRRNDGVIVEWEIAWEGTSGYDLLKLTNSLTGMSYADADTCYALKLSHRYLRNSPHFYKTMEDVKYLRSLGCMIPEGRMCWYIQREKETYSYNHPDLNVDKGSFFKEGEGVPYTYDHDSIHVAVACGERPAYTYYMVDGQDVMCSADKFFAVDDRTRLLGVVEESMVLALERSLIPFNFEPDPGKMFKYALMKVCTSITSGWFREYAWENHDKAVELYEQELGSDYMERCFKIAVENGKLLPFKT